MERYYQDLLAQDTKAVEFNEHDRSLSNGTDKESSKDSECAPEKWKGQIEKVVRCMDFESRSSMLSICGCYLPLRGDLTKFFNGPTSIFYAGFASNIPRTSCSR